MLKNKIDFDRICDIIPVWSWSELKVGLEKSLISYSEIISYAVRILSDEVDQFDRVVELSIAEEDEVEELIFKLALDEEKKDLELVTSKWIFAIIYATYSYLNNEIYNVIEDVYVKFEYPQEIKHLIGYMPCDDGRSMDVRLNEYIEINRNIWC